MLKHMLETDTKQEQKFLHDFFFFGEKIQVLETSLSKCRREAPSVLKEIKQTKQEEEPGQQIFLLHAHINYATIS